MSQRTITVRGVVFFDRNGNARKDADEPGVPDVCVQDGEHILATKADGSYCFDLPVADEVRFIYITRPTGYKPTSPFFLRIDPKDPRTDYTCDFGLQENPASLLPDFSFLVVADSQFVQQAEADLLRQEFAQIAQISGAPAFLVNCGDLTMAGTDDQMRMYRQALEPVEMPVYHVFGGHDGKAEKGVLSIGNFQKWLGPAWYAWDYGKRHCLTYVSEDIFLSANEKRRQAKWLEEDIARQPKGAEIVVFTHLPLGDFDAWAQDHKLVAVFYGHRHQNCVFTHKDIPLIMTGPIRGQDWGAFTRTYRVGRFAGGKFSTELRPTGQYERLVLVSPRPGGTIGRGTIPIHVLAYDSSAWIKDVRATITGPGARAEMVLKNLGQWTWQCAWNTDKLKSGEYQIVCSAVSDRGKSWEKRFAFSLADGPHVVPRPGSDWPFLLRSYAANRNAEHGLAPPLLMAWAVHTGGRAMEIVSPVFYNGVVYAGVQADDVDWPGGGIAAYDGVTGAVKWKTLVNGSVRYGICALSGRIYGMTSDSKVCCLDAGTGRILWTKVLDPHGGHGLIQTALVPHQDKIIACAYPGPLLFLLDAQTGQVVQHYKFIDHLYPVPMAPAVAGSVLYFGYGGKLHAVEIETGRPVWAALQAKSLKYQSMPVVSGGRIFINAIGGLHAVDCATGKIMWIQGFKAGTRALFCPVVSAGVVYGGGSEIIAVDIATGEKIWTFAIELTEEMLAGNKRQTLGGSSSPVVAGNYVYFGADNGCLYGLDKQTGREAWRHAIGVPLKSSPVVSGNVLYVMDYDGNLYAFAETSKH